VRPCLRVGGLATHCFGPQHCSQMGEAQGQLTQPAQLVTTVTATVASYGLGMGTGDGIRNMFCYNRSGSQVTR